jgi:hypothetical protein
MTKEDLAMRLDSMNSLNDNIKEKYIFELEKENINPARIWKDLPYLKYDLTNSITEHITERGIPFDLGKDLTLYSSINKEPLKRIEYGIRSAREIPIEILERLLDWEKLYLFAGKWGKNGKRCPNISISDLTLDYLKTGTEVIYKNHYVNKASGRYVTELVLPEAKGITELHKERFGKAIILSAAKSVPKNEQLKLF